MERGGGYFIDIYIRTTKMSIDESEYVKNFVSFNSTVDYH